MTINETIMEYKNGEIDKKTYITSMFERYRELFNIQDVVKKNESVRSIQISEEGIFLSVRNKNVRGEEYFINMEISPEDASAVPVTILNFEEYEKDELDMVMKICSYLEKNGGGVFFDVGANLGWYTLNICKNFKNIQGYAFEPVDETYRRMERNVKLNGLNNCILCHCGLSNEDKNLMVYYKKDESGASSLHNIREDSTAIQVECKFKRLDGFVKENEIEKLDFIKCDVEGSELFVYQGGLETIKKNKPIIFSEMLRKWAAKFGYHPNEIIELLKKLGYQCYVIEKHLLKEFSEVDDNTIETNYFFLHTVKHKKLIKEIVV